MFRVVDDLVLAISEESSRTLAVFNALSPTSLSVKSAPQGWSIAELAWHIVEAYSKILGQVGLSVSAPQRELDSLGVLLASYRFVTEEVRAAVTREWQDSSLLELHSVYGVKWSRGHACWILFLHEAHHRGQLIFSLRGAGLPVPDAYGPARK